MNEVFNGAVEWFKEKTSSPLYFVFTLALIGTHWKYFFTLFFEDHLPSGVTRIEYAGQLLDGILVTIFFEWLNVLLTPIINFLYHSFIPAIIAYLAVFQLPKIYNIAHSKNLLFHFKRKLEFDLQANKYEKERVGLLKERERAVVAQQETTEKIAKAKKSQKETEKTFSKEDTWESEFQELKNENKEEYMNLDYLRKILISPFIDGNERSHVVYAQAIGLMDFEDNRRAVLTEKGKYFVKRYIEEINKF